MSSPWSIDGEIARLQLGPLAAQLNIGLPQLGLHQVRLSGEPATIAPSAFLRVVLSEPEAPEPIQDCYIRRHDLVVTYAETAARNIRPQFYWRAFAFPEEQSQAYGVDLILSTQTSQLYSDPTLWVESLLPAFGEPCAISQAGDAGLLLFRLNPPAWTYAQAVHPSDFIEVNSTLDGNGAMRHRLFAPGLEKGVIRRARVRGVFMPAERAEDLAAASYNEFVEQDLPLTT